MPLFALTMDMAARLVVCVATLLLSLQGCTSLPGAVARDATTPSHFVGEDLL